jgi:uncharacterized damage-inducible protein DinB
MLPESTQLRLEHQLECIPVLVADVPAQKLQQRPASGKWSAAENLAHLARYHEIFLKRIASIMAEDRPAFTRYKAEDDPGWPEFAELPIPEVLARLQRSRRDLLDQIGKLPGEAFQRTAIHPVYGEMSLAVWVEFFLLHEAHHLMVVLQRAREV